MHVSATSAGPTPNNKLRHVRARILSNAFSSSLPPVKSFRAPRSVRITNYRHESFSSSVRPPVGFKSREFSSGVIYRSRGKVFPPITRRTVVASRPYLVCCLVAINACRIIYRLVRSTRATETCTRDRPLQILITRASSVVHV